MAYLQEIKITKEAPIIGSTKEPNIIFIVPITDKTCDMYASDNDGVVRATSVQVPVFNSVKEANASISTNNRFEGKTVLIRNTYSKEVPVLDEEGEPVLETITFDDFITYSWKNGIEDEHLIVQAPKLSEVLANGNVALGGQHIKFLSEGLPDTPPIYWEGNGDLNVTVGTSKDGTSFIATNSELNDFISEEGNFMVSDERQYNKNIYACVIIGRNAASNITKSLSASTLVGLDTGLNAIGGLGGDTLIGAMAGAGFNYIAPALQDYRLNGSFNDGSHNTFNVIVGRSGGLKYKEGAGNVLIGHNTSDDTDNKYGEIWETLIINGDKRYSFSAQLHLRNAGAQREKARPLIVGKFDEDWFEVNGKLKLRPYYNSLKKEGDAITLANQEVSKWQTKVDELNARLLVLEQRKIENENTNLSSFHNSAYDRGVKYLQEANSELTRAQNFANQEEVPNFRENGILTIDTTDLGEVVVAKKTDFILDVIREMTPEQLMELKTILGVTTEPEPEV